MPLEQVYSTEEYIENFPEETPQIDTVFQQAAYEEPRSNEIIVLDEDVNAKSSTVPLENQADQHRASEVQDDGLVEILCEELSAINQEQN